MLLAAALAAAWVLAPLAAAIRGWPRRSPLSPAPGVTGDGAGPPVDRREAR
jgi:hypothetical protein